MTKEEIIETLKLEKSIVEDGGYGRYVRTPWRRSQYFRDSITCPNVCEVEKVYPCTECFLIDYVHPSYRDVELPCHFVQLNSAGDTIDSLQRQGDMERLEEVLLGWLDSTIKQLESQKAKGITPERQKKTSPKS